MKLSRLIETITILLYKRTVTAAELADRFGVSVRTIYRDIDLLSASGIPIYTTQGPGGGISLMEHYTVSRAMLSKEDQNSIFLALHTLKSTRYPEAEAALEKLGSIFRTSVSDWISVDFSPWGANPNASDKFIDIKTAILQCRVIQIDYINARNQKSTRTVEPLRLDFKSQAWYLWGWCRKRGDFRTFRISRVKRVSVLEETFHRNECLARRPAPAGSGSGPSRSVVHCELQFTDGALYRLYDDYDDDRIQRNGDGTYTLQTDFPEDDWLYGYILSFGDSVKVIKPVHLRQIIRQKAQTIAGFYQ